LKRNPHAVESSQKPHCSGRQGYNLFLPTSNHHCEVFGSGYGSSRRYSREPGSGILSYYNEATGKWSLVETTFDGAHKTLSVSTTHFSTWAILVKPSSGGLALWIRIVIGIAAALAVGVVVVRAINVERMNKVP
jgi:hypothetical protein